MALAVVGFHKFDIPLSHALFCLEYVVDNLIGGIDPALAYAQFFGKSNTIVSFLERRRIDDPFFRTSS